MDSRSRAPGPIHTLMTCCAMHVYCIGWSIAVGPVSATVVPLPLTQFAVPFVQIVTTVCLRGRWFYTNFYDMCSAWFMVLGPWVDLIHCSLNQSERLPILPFDWEKLVYTVASQNPTQSPVRTLHSRQSEPFVDETCSLETEHHWCAKNQALANHRCSAEHSLLHALVDYMIQLALKHTFVYTQYNHVFWALIKTTTKGCNPIVTCKSGILGGLAAILYVYQQRTVNLQIDDSRFERLDSKGCPPPGRKSHLFVSYFQKAKNHEKQMKFWRWLEEKVETSSSYGKIRKLEMCVSDCTQCVGSGFLFLVSRNDPVRTNRSTFCLIVVFLFVCFKFA